MMFSASVKARPRTGRRIVLADPGVRETRARIEAAKTKIPAEIWCARLQPFQDR